MGLTIRPAIEGGLAAGLIIGLDRPRARPALSCDQIQSHRDLFAGEGGDQFSLDNLLERSQDHLDPMDEHMIFKGVAMAFADPAFAGRVERADRLSGGLADSLHVGVGQADDAECGLDFRLDDGVEIGDR